MMIMKLHTINKKQKVILVLFLLILSLTVIFAVALVIEDIERAKENDDIFGATLSIPLFVTFYSPVIIAEADISFGCFYFASDRAKKKWYKTLLNIICAFSSAFIIFLFTNAFAFNFSIKLWEILLLGSVLGYLMLRIIYILIVIICRSIKVASTEQKSL